MAVYGHSYLMDKPMKILKSLCLVFLSALSLSAYAASECRISFRANGDLVYLIQQKGFILPSDTSNSYDKVCGLLKKSNAELIFTEVHYLDRDKWVSSTTLELVDKNLLQHGVVLTGLNTIQSFGYKAGENAGNLPYDSAMKALSLVGEEQIKALEDARNKLRNFDRKKADQVLSKKRSCGELKFASNSTALTEEIKKNGFTATNADQLCGDFTKHHIGIDFNTNESHSKKLPDVYTSVMQRYAPSEYVEQDIPVRINLRYVHLSGLTLLTNPDSSPNELKMYQLPRNIWSNFDNTDIAEVVRQVNAVRKYLSDHPYK